MRFRALSAALLLLTSCGYRAGDQGILCRYSTISVPFVCGDERGRLTDELVVELSKTGAIRYVAHQGQLTLCASIVDCGRENIGFEYDRNRGGIPTRRIVPDEGRLFAVVEVTLKDACGCTLIGPTRFTSHVDYNFNPLVTNTQLATFSLGQFTEIDQAEEVAMRPLYRDLAKKIVDYLVAYW